MITTISVTDETSKILREWSKRTDIPLLDLMHEFSKALKQGLDQLDDDKRLLCMSSWDMKNKMLHLRLSDAFIGAVSIGELGLPKQEIEKLFGYCRDKDGKLIDLTEKVKEA